MNNELEGGGRGLLWGSALAFAGGAEGNHGNVCQIIRYATVLVSITVSKFVENSFLYVAALLIPLEVACPELAALQQIAQKMVADGD